MSRSGSISGAGISIIHSVLISLMFSNIVMSQSSDFIEIPSNLTVPLGSTTDATFSCQHDTADIISWLVNGTAFNNYFGFQVSSTVLYHGAPPLNRLIVPVHQLTNETTYTIVCVAFFLGSTPREESPPALLKIRENATLLPTGFTEEPDSILTTDGENQLVLAEGEEPAEFRCQHCTADDINWRLNGTLLLKFSLPDGISINYTFQEYCGIIFILRLTNITTYNQTTIQCTAIMNGEPGESTTPIELLVQGQLGPVSNVTKQVDDENNITRFMWHHPCSLNLTNAEPDIAYCVRIFAKFCPKQMKFNNIIEDSNITENYYTIQNDYYDEDELLRIEILPRSNLPMGLKGTQVASYEDEYVYLDSTAVTYVIHFLSMETAEVTTVLNLEDTDPLSIKPRNVSLELWPIDANSEKTAETKTVHLMLLDTITNTKFAYLKSVEPHLQIQKLYLSRVISTNPSYPSCNVDISNFTELSTHYIQNITATAISNNEIMVSVDFVNSSIPSGFLAIAYTDSENDPEIHYGIGVRSDEKLYSEVVLEVLADYQTEYRISVFSISNQTGVPFEMSAATGKRVVSTQAGQKPSQDNVNTPVENIPTVKNEKGCLSCEFNDNLTSCVIITSKKSDLVTNYGLLNINVFKLQHKDDGCKSEFQDLIMNANDYNAAVFNIYEGMITGQGAHLNVTLNGANSNAVEVRFIVLFTGLCGAMHTHMTMII